VRSLLAILLLLSRALYGQSTQTAQHIERIETGLIPPIRVTNQPPLRMDLREEMRIHHVPAVSIAVIHQGQIEWAKAYGFVSQGGAAATTETLFQAASISKSLTTMAALHLVALRKLSLDSPINAELKAWKLPSGKATHENPVTLRELLSHTAGVNVHGFGGYAAGDPVPTLAQVRDGVKPANSPAIVVDQVPGQMFRYSGGGFVVAQQAMIDATGTPFPELLRKTIFNPLGMLHSTFEQPLPSSLRANAAQPVDEKGNPIPGGWHTYPEMAAAGLWTTPTDLAKWLIEMQRSLSGHANHVLSAAMTRTMLTPVKGGYGLGVEVSSSNDIIRFSHGGANAGYRAHYFADSEGHGVVIMTSSDGGGVLIGELLRGIDAEYGWNVYPQTDRSAAVIPFEQQRSYIGSFKSKDGFQFTVSAENDHLTIQFSDGTSGPFLPSDSRSFFAVVSTLQVHFTSPDAGELIFAPDDRVEFARIQ